MEGEFLFLFSYLAWNAEFQTIKTWNIRINPAWRYYCTCMPLQQGICPIKTSSHDSCFHYPYLFGEMPPEGPSSIRGNPPPNIQYIGVIMKLCSLKENKKRKLVAPSKFSGSGPFPPCSPIVGCPHAILWPWVLQVGSGETALGCAVWNHHFNSLYSSWQKSDAQAPLNSCSATHASQDWWQLKYMVLLVFFRVWIRWSHMAVLSCFLSCQEKMGPK